MRKITTPEKITARSQLNTTHVPPVMGNTVEAVMAAWRDHPGVMGTAPFAWNVYTSEELYMDTIGKLYRKLPGAALPLTDTEHTAFLSDLAEGAVEIYLQRPSAGIRSDLIRPKTVIHQATLTPLPLQ